MQETIHFVAHGSSRGRDLNTLGRLQAERARDYLIQEGIGRRALLLSSLDNRAMQTANIIATGIRTDIHPSSVISAGGAHPRHIANLDDWIERALEEVGTDISESSSGLVVITHTLLLNALKGIRHGEAYHTVPHGEVYRYTPGTWENQDYTPEHAARLGQFTALIRDAYFN